MSIKTIKAVCPKCNEANCFNVWNDTSTVQSLNASKFTCSFCFKRSDKEMWKDASGHTESGNASN